MQKVDADDRLVAHLDDPNNPTQRYRFSLADLGQLCAQLEPSDLLVLLSRLESVLLVGVRDVRVIPVPEPNRPPPEARLFPLVIQASPDLEQRLGQGIVDLCREHYGVEPAGHADRLLLMVPKARVLPAAARPPGGAIPLNGSSSKS